MKTLTPAAALLSVSLAFQLYPVDWPQYRGPSHDGSTTEEVRTDWNSSPPRVVWRRNLGPGWSSITVANGRAFTQVRRSAGGSQREFCVALDAATGNELWARDVDAADYSDLAGYDNNLDGPRSTPTVDGTEVFVLTSHLKLYCLKASDGSLVWRRDFLAEFPGTGVIEWQNAASPLVVGDRVFLNSNVPNFRLTAVRRSDGQTLWRTQNDTMTHATPVWTTLGGVPQVVFLTLSGLVGVEPSSGSVLWRYPFTASSTSTAATPIASGDLLYASAAYGRGAWTARVRNVGGTFTVSETSFRQSTANQNHWASPILHQGHIYSVVERSLRSLACYEPLGRTNAWTTSQVGSGNPGFASLIKAGRNLIVLTEPGELVLVDPSPRAYQELGRFQALSGLCWNHPALSNGRLYARSSSEVVALDVGVPRQPLPPFRLSLSHRPIESVLELRLLPASESPLPTDAPDRLTLQSTDAFLEDRTLWSGVPTSWSAPDGIWTTTLPLPANTRLYRVIEPTSN